MSNTATWRQKAAEIRFDLRPLVGGQRIESESNETIVRHSPADGKALYELPAGAQADVESAVIAARQVFDQGHWANMSPMVRKMILMGFAGLVDANAEQLALLDSVEMGKPISQAQGDIVGAAHIIRHYAEQTDKVYGKSSASAPSLVQYTLREPRGVVAAIVPWNYPSPNAALKFAPALAAGNSVVLKPSELSSSSALRFAELAVEAGVPPGTFNVVPGTGPAAGAALAAHPGVDFIAFTGSTATGRKLLEIAGQSSLKPLQLECGGKSANMVFEDCGDLDAIAQDAAHRIFGNQGQLCVAGTRLIAHVSLVEPLIEKIVAAAGGLHIGDPLDPDTNFGPLASTDRRSAVLASCRAGVEAGARVRCGGEAVAEFKDGCYVAPTVFSDVAPDSDLAQQDIFGPVLSVFGFGSDDEAVSLANHSRYGLSASVWTRDVAIANRMVRQLRVGRVTVLSCRPDPAAFAFPMGSEPWGQSGFGVESGTDGYEVYTHLKAVEMHV